MSVIETDLWLGIAPLDVRYRTLRRVVEDDPSYQYLVKMAFSSHGEQTRWALTVATNGQEALNILFDEDKGAPLPDLILLDWSLPRVRGQ